jgi:hypothetical protein
MVVPKKLTTDMLSKVKAYNSCESKERGTLNKKANTHPREDAAESLGMKKRFRSSKIFFRPE